MPQKDIKPIQNARFKSKNLPKFGSSKHVGNKLLDKWFLKHNWCNYYLEIIKQSIQYIFLLYKYLQSPNKLVCILL